MLSPIEHRELLSAAWPTVSLFALTGLLIVAWFLLHLFLGKVTNFASNRVLGVIGFVARSIVGTLSLFLLINVMARFFVLETTSSLWLGAAIFAVAVEFVVATYDWEARLVAPWIGRLIVGLRVAGVLLLGLVLLQPVFAWSIPRIEERFVAVLVDQSTSMDLTDEQLTDSEKLALLRILDSKLPASPHDLASLPHEFRALAESMAMAAEQLLSLPDDSTTTRLSAETLAMEQVANAASEQLTNASARLKDFTECDLAIEATSREQASQMMELIDSQLQARLSNIKDAAADSSAVNMDLIHQIADHLQAVSASLRDSGQSLPRIIDAADRAFYASLPPESLERAEKIARRTRADIARGLLLGEGDAKGVLEKIVEGYSVRCFGFDSEIREVDAADVASLFPVAPQANSEEATESAVADVTTDETESSDATEAPSAAAEEQTAETTPASTPESDRPDKLTNLAQALEHVRSEIPTQSLAGILLISDGRQSEAADLDEIATRFSAVSVPISSLVVGSERPPVDAKILEVTRPNTVLVGDSLVVGTRVAITGMKGRSVVAKLVSGGETLEERTIEVPEDEFITNLELSYEPEEEGLVEYEVVLEPVGADEIERSAFQLNNRRTFSVAVSDERTEILIIEGKPRWEYGYLRNLFAGRDATVQLQTVLFEPERLASTTNLPIVFASAGREANQVEATALPENETEWFKFDVIILGDVDQSALSAEQQELIQRFVSQRGGALIVISGADHMPHAWTDQPLSELFPIDVAPTQEVQFKAPEPSYRWQLTSVGERHAITRQGDSIDASRSIWERMPEMYWRHSVTGVKPGSVVLAYAEPDGLPEPSEATDANAQQNPESTEQQDSQADPVDSSNDRTVDQQTLFEQQHALLAIRNYGAGRVLMLATDHSWRFRYRVGDTYHHRFWGQIVRWGTAEKLQAGGDYVQLGTDRQEYTTGDPVRVTARLTDNFFAPIEDSQAEVRVYRGDAMIVSQRLIASSDRPGDYSATLTDLSEPGSYRIELVSEEADRVFSGSNDSKIETTIEVQAPEIASPELQETTADVATLERLALRTGGGLIQQGNSDPSRWFAEGTRRYAEMRRLRFWDSWPILVMLMAVFTAEWIVRKKGGLV